MTNSTALKSRHNTRRSVEEIFDQIVKITGVPEKKGINTFGTPSDLQSCELTALDNCMLLQKLSLNRVPPSTYQELLNQAVEVLKFAAPDLLSRLLSVTKYVSVFDDENVNSFALKEGGEAIYMNLPLCSSIAFFVEEITHQASHNYLNSATNKPNQFFTCQSSKKLPNRTAIDNRSVFDALHGIFTQSIMCAGLSLCSASDKISIMERRLMAGRALYSSIRFRLGVTRILDANVLSNDGIKFIRCMIILTENSVKAIDLLPQKPVFTEQGYNFSDCIYYSENNFAD